MAYTTVVVSTASDLAPLTVYRSLFRLCDR